MTSDGAKEQVTFLFTCPGALAPSRSKNELWHREKVIYKRERIRSLASRHKSDATVWGKRNYSDGRGHRIYRSTSTLQKGLLRGEHNASRARTLKTWGSRLRSPSRPSLPARKNLPSKKYQSGTKTERLRSCREKQVACEVGVAGGNDQNV